MFAYRLNRLFNSKSGRCLNVAVDHGFFGEPAFLSGIADLPAAVDVLCSAGPDAIQLTRGSAMHLQARRGREKPTLVLRTDVANVYGPRLPGVLFSTPIEAAAEAGARLDAACVVVNLFDIEGQSDLRRQCIDNIVRLRAECDRLAMPLMVEPLVMRPGAAEGPYGVDGDLERIRALVRQSVELGADLIKADPTDDIRDYHSVIEVAAGVPVLVRGGGRVPDDVLLARTAAVIEQGASGIVYGRNIIQHRDPRGITLALLAILHDGATADEAAARVGSAA
jgi:DhnA family fructose-bisphosphate aldolase class Ia